MSSVILNFAMQVLHKSKTHKFKIKNATLQSNDILLPTVSLTKLNFTEDA